MTISSPHTRRYFHGQVFLVGQLFLFSAHAEVFPEGGGDREELLTLLRTRGGISYFLVSFFISWGSSPHTRRYFLFCRRVFHRMGLFSAHAEVFPGIPANSSTARPLLRTRGGISQLGVLGLG